MSASISQDDISAQLAAQENCAANGCMLHVHPCRSEPFFVPCTRCTARAPVSGVGPGFAGGKGGVAGLSMSVPCRKRRCAPRWQMRMGWTWPRWRQKRRLQAAHVTEGLARSGLLPGRQQSGRVWQPLMSSARPGMMAAGGVEPLHTGGSWLLMLRCIWRAGGRAGCLWPGSLSQSSTCHAAEMLFRGTGEGML